MSRGAPSEVTLYIGGVHVSRAPVLIKTVLGSCIAVCLHDPEARIGGMNHFMLPAPADDDPVGTPGRFGVQAMELLITGIQKLGGDRRRLVAKLFGGGHVLGINERRVNVPQRNIQFIRAYMDAEQLPVVAQDLGGTQARRVHFYTETGRVLVKRLGSGSLRALRLPQAEQEAAARRPDYGPVIWFDEPGRER